MGHGAMGQDVCEEGPLELTPVEEPELSSGRSLAKPRILIVEDDVADLAMVRRALTRGGAVQFELFETSCAETALAVVEGFQPDCILLDNHLPNCSGLEFVSRMNDRYGPDFAAIVMITGDESQRTGIDAMKLGVSDLLSKSEVPAVDLSAFIGRVLEARKRRQAAGRRVYAEKLASLSQLVAGAAHEINNPAAIARLTLSAVGDALENMHESGMSTMDQTQLHRLEELVRAADEALARIGSVVRSLERETGTSLGQIHQLSLDQAVRSAQPTIAQLLEHGKQVSYSLNSSDAFVGDVAQLTRVVVDLVKNGLEAVEAGGTVEVSTSTDGDFVELRVDDDGPGVEKDRQALIFEPLYTNKRARGAGALGMGLPRASAVVERHGGYMRVQRSPRGGARFEAIIPKFKGDTSPRSSSLLPRSRRTSQDGLRVLVVDDDVGIRASYERVLRLHFEVQTAGSSEQAMALIDQRRYDVILCDVIMPGVDGVGFAQQLRERHPEQAEVLLFCTGGVLEAEQERFLSGWSNGYLRKPLSANELTECLRSFAAARIAQA